MMQFTTNAESMLNSVFTPSFAEYMIKFWKNSTTLVAQINGMAGNMHNQIRIMDVPHSFVTQLTGHSYIITISKNELREDLSTVLASKIGTLMANKLKYAQLPLNLTMVDKHKSADEWVDGITQAQALSLVNEFRVWREFRQKQSKIELWTSVKFNDRNFLFSMIKATLGTTVEEPDFNQQALRAAKEWLLASNPIDMPHLSYTASCHFKWLFICKKDDIEINDIDLLNIKPENFSLK